MVGVFVIVFVTAIFVSYVSAVQVKEKLNLHLCEKMILNVSMNVSLLICSTYIFTVIILPKIGYKTGYKNMAI